MIKVLLALTFSTLAFANINKAYFEYSAGNYIKASSILHKIIGKQKQTKDFGEELAMAYFMKGVILNRLGNYEKAIKSFLKLKLQNKDLEGLSYELGQALYAVGNLEDALKEFLMSIKKRYQITASVYYAATIYKAKKQYQKAFFFLEKIHQLKINDYNIKQMAWLQIAEIHLEQLQKSKAILPYLENVVLPSYMKALHFDPSSSLSEFINTRIHNVKVRYAIADKKYRKKRINYDAKVNQFYTGKDEETVIKEAPAKKKTHKR